MAESSALSADFPSSQSQMEPAALTESPGKLQNKTLDNVNESNKNKDEKHSDKDTESKTLKNSENGELAKVTVEKNSPAKKPVEKDKNGKKLADKTPKSSDEESDEDEDKHVVKEKKRTEKADTSSPAKPDRKRKADDTDSTGEKASKKLNSGKISTESPMLDRGSKRESKKVDRLSIDNTTPKNDKPLEIPDGSGKRLGDIKNIATMLENTKCAELKTLHHLMFKRHANPTELKRHIRQFSGFTFDTDSTEYKTRVAFINKKVTQELKLICAVLNIARSGTKENLVESIMQFLMKPEETDQPLRPLHGKKKRRSSSKSKSKEKKKGTKKAQKTKESKGKKTEKKKSKEDSSSGNESSEDDEEEESEEEKEVTKSKKVDKSPKKRSVSKSSEEEEESEEETKKKKKVASGKQPAKKAKKDSDNDDEDEDDDERKGKDDDDDDDDDENEESDGSGDEFKPGKSKTKKKPAKASKVSKPKTKPVKETKPKEKKAEKKQPAKKKIESDDGSSSEDEPLVKVEKSKKPPTDEELKIFIKKLLTGANLEEVTMKTVCTKVYEAHPGFDLTDRKDFIKAAVKDIIR